MHREVMDPGFSPGVTGGDGPPVKPGVTSIDFATALIDQDIRKVYPEPRYVALGFLSERLHVLCFTPALDGIRVISFRKANSREVKIYDEQARSVD